MNRLLRLLSALVAGILATAEDQPKQYTLYLFSPDSAKTRRRQLRACEMERRYIRFEIGVVA